jgi:hypothetical protein
MGFDSSAEALETAHQLDTIVLDNQDLTKGNLLTDIVESPGVERRDPDAGRLRGG